jgi:hypothetical protein
MKRSHERLQLEPTKRPKPDCKPDLDYTIFAYNYDQLLTQTGEQFGRSITKSQTDLQIVFHPELNLKQ